MTAKDLKNALLQEAVQGKLVPQIASEGNARDLLEQIRKERGESLPLAAERKRSSATPSAGSNAARNACSKSHSELVSESIPEDEIPFDIPESWCWCRLGDVLSEVIVPQRDKPKVFDGTIPWCRIEDRDGDLLNGTKSNQYVSEKTVKEMNLKIYPIGTVLSASSGASIGSILINTVECCSNQTFIGLVCGDLLLNKYLYYFLHSIIPSLKLMGTGTTLAYISKDKYRQMNFPLPPLAEQKRIVEAIEKFMPLIEEYGKKEAVLKELNANIGTLTKKAILQEAVQGKLVPQIPAEGNAKDLLEQIKAEKAKLIKEGKIKKEKPLPEIMEDEIPFDIPENWCWCRFNEIFQIINGDRGKNYPAKSTLSKNGIPFISALNLENNTVLKDDRLLCVSETQFNKLGSGKLKKNDMVVCIRGSLGKHGVYPFEQGAIASSLVIVREYTKEALLSEFLNIYLDSTLFFQEITDYDNGTAQPNLAAESFKKFLFPLPPLSEQKRIIAAIEQLLPLCEKLGK